MKKITLPLLVALLSLTNANAQEKGKFNQWSIDLNGGLTKPTNPMSNGFYTDTFDSFIHVDAGVRYMFNNKFGLKVDFGYDDMKNSSDSYDFKTKYYRTNIQGVANLGRILNFEDWTSVLNLQAHAGVGYSWMTNDYFSGKDQMGNALAGLTAQIKLGNRVALNADFTIIKNIDQDYTFDGRSSVEGSKGFDGTLYNATIGFSFYLGKHKQHADWYSSEKDFSRFEEIENRVTVIENNLLDSDGDGVPDYLDLEPNTPAGNMVNIKGVSIDLNKNGIPDSYEAYFAEFYGKGEKLTPTDSNTARTLINDGYVSMYFDFDKSQPKNVDAAHFILTYLKSNPNSSVEINGYADSVGNTDYNRRLSDKRAKNVAKILEQSGISSSRIKVVGQGEDTSLNGKNKNASSFARRVTFKVK